MPCSCMLSPAEASPRRCRTMPSAVACRLSTFALCGACVSAPAGLLSAGFVRKVLDAIEDDLARSKHADDVTPGSLNEQLLLTEIAEAHSLAGVRRWADWRRRQRSTPSPERQGVLQRAQKYTREKSA